MVKKNKNTLHKTKYPFCGTKRFAPSVVSGSSPVVAHMMVTGGLHGR
jgi:hypothetical protein